MNHRIVLRCFLGVALGAGIVTTLLSSRTEAIIREKPVEARDHPELVVISAKHPKREGERRFSGALIAKNLVLTGARCVRGFHAWDIEAPYVKNGPVKRSTRKHKVHPDFDPRHSSENAIALLILEEDVDVGKKLPPLYDGDPLAIGTKLFVAGRTDNGKVSRDRLYLSDTVSVVEYQEDSHVYGGVPHVVQRGDMGGPVYNAESDPKIVAVVTGYFDNEFGWAEPSPTDLFSPILKKHKMWVAGVAEEIQRERSKSK
jgi:hypothetical protein